MAVASRQNITLSYDGNDLTDYMNQADLGATLNQIDATVFSSTGQENIVDNTEWSISFSGYWSVALDNILAPDAVNPGTKKDAVIGFTDETAQTVTYTWTANAMIQNYGVSAAIGSLIGNDTALVLSGAPVRAVA